MTHHNTLYTGDNLHVMRCLESESVDLIYLDPPFNTMKMRKWKDDKGKEQSYTDLWHWKELKDDHGYHSLRKNGKILNYLPVIKIMHDEAMMIYITFMASRLIEMHRVLKSTGSIYLHCDWRACHYLRSILDIIFGKKNFRNEIIWERDPPGKGAKKRSKQFPRNTDTILCYSKSDDREFLQPYKDLTKKQERAYSHNDGDRKYKTVMLGDYTEKSIESMRKKGLIHVSSTGKEYKKYYLDEATATVGCIWNDIYGFGTMTNSKERTGHDSQKPLALLKRIIEASSKKDDIVLDPFCGCATACVAAHQLDRKWIGIDSNEKTQTHLIKSLEDKTTGKLFTDFIHLHWEGKKGGFLKKKDGKKDEVIIKKRGDLNFKNPRDKTVIEHFYGIQLGHCSGCKEHLKQKLLEVDHIIPKSKGGVDAIENYQLLCSSCNRTKGNRTQLYLEERLEEIKKAQKDTSY